MSWFTQKYRYFQESFLLIKPDFHCILLLEKRIVVSYLARIVISSTDVSCFPQQYYKIWGQNSEDNWKVVISCNCWPSVLLGSTVSFRSSTIYKVVTVKLSDKLANLLSILSILLPTKTKSFSCLITSLLLNPKRLMDYTKYTPLACFLFCRNTQRSEWHYLLLSLNCANNPSFYHPPSVIVMCAPMTRTLPLNTNNLSLNSMKTSQPHHIENRRFERFCPP